MTPVSLASLVAAGLWVGSRPRRTYFENFRNLLATTGPRRLESSKTFKPHRKPGPEIGVASSLRFLSFRFDERRSARVAEIVQAFLLHFEEIVFFVDERNNFSESSSVAARAASSIRRSRFSCT